MPIHGDIQDKELVKSKAWEKLFLDYGRGVTMYRYRKFVICNLNKIKIVLFNLELLRLLNW